MAKKVKTTTRSYTLRLKPPSDANKEIPLSERLFLTHEAVCQGAAGFGELFLNMRGGLSPQLADDVDEKLDGDKRANAIRGRRRMLALGWLSVEDERGAGTHPFRVQNVPAGESLSRDSARELLRAVLELKGIASQKLQQSWIEDCADAMTARVRDAVWVNRAAAFHVWQEKYPKIAADMPEHARITLFRLCGSNFIDLQLPEDATVVSATESENADDEIVDSDTGSSEGNAAEEGADPNIASRRIFGELFGGDAAAKQDRAKGKFETADKLKQFLLSRDARQPLRPQLEKWRADSALSPLDTSRPEKYPTEVTSSGAPTAIAKRYRKLLVTLGMWPDSDDESGVPRLQARDKYAKQLNAWAADDPNIAINALDLLAACETETKSLSDDTNDGDQPAQIVLKPAWATEFTDKQSLREQFSPAMLDSSASEFRRLMFALAARRISQTQTWIRRNEAERHKAAVKQFVANRELEELDPGGAARVWLEDYELRRTELTGSDQRFQITRRAIAECDRVIAAWRGISQPKARDEKTASIQESSEKFGDPQLYIDLAHEPGADVVWQQRDGSTTHEILGAWVRFRQAQTDQSWLKIPRYCHPDPFHHPTWCEFGSSKPKVWYELAGSERPSKPEPGGDADGLQRMWLLLPNFQTNETRATPLRWLSMRLKEDFGVSREAKLVTGLPRADRASVAASGAKVFDANGKKIPNRPSHPFSDDASSWNARLQVDRESLAKLERLWDADSRQWLDGGRALRRLRWFVTFAPSLEISAGPMRELLNRLGHKKLPISDWNKKQKREGRAKFILSRLPNLRILSVDLGHRYAAACAVWETISTSALRAVCDAVGCSRPTDESLFWFVPRIVGGQERGRFVYRRIGATTLPDGSPHPAPWARLDRQFLIKLQGEDEPARSATNEERAEAESLECELGYQRREPRRTADWRIDELMSDVVRTVRLALRNHGDYARIAGGLIAAERLGMGNRAPVKLIGNTLVEYLAGLLDLWHELAKSSRWQDDFARAKWQEHIVPKLKDIVLTEDTDEMSGSERKAARTERRNQLTTVAQQLAQDEGHRVKLSAEWQQEWSRRDGTPAVMENEVDANGNRTGNVRVIQPATGWHATLNWLNRWIMPQGKNRKGQTPKHDRSIRHVGGLSLNRIATFKSLYQVQKAFFTRQKPDNKKPDPAGEGFGQRTLDALERMRENRVKQLASRLVEAALGIGVEQSRTEQGKQRPRPRERIADPRFAPCHAVVIENLTHYRPDELQTRRENRQLMTWASAQVKKHLTDQCQLHGLHLREVQPGYTSRQDFRTGAPGVRCVDVPVAEFLGPAEGPLGRHVRQAIKNLLKGTSGTAETRRAEGRQPPDDSERTNEVRGLTPAGSQNTDGNWSAKLERARAKASETSGPKKSGTAWDRYVLALYDQLSQLTPDKAKSRFARIPQKGGDIFVSANDEWPKDSDGRVPGVQADLNAAGNIGLKALLDPDWHGAWWYIPASLDGGWRVPAEKSTAGAACLKNWKVGESPAGLFQAQSAGGRALTLADDTQVQAADELVKEAKKKWDAAKAESKEAKKGPRGKSLLSHEAALELEAVAKTNHDQAKKDHAAAKKGANAKSVVNLWRFLSEQSPHDCDWREYKAFENRVRWRVIQRLHQALKLSSDLPLDDE